MVKLQFFSRLEFKIPSAPNFPSFKLEILFREYEDLTETELANGPIFFAYNFNYTHIRRAYKKWFREVDRLVVEIKRIKDYERIKPYLTWLSPEEKFWELWK